MVFHKNELQLQTGFADKNFVVHVSFGSPNVISNWLTFAADRDGLIFQTSVLSLIN